MGGNEEMEKKSEEADSFVSQITGRMEPDVGEAFRELRRGGQSPGEGLPTATQRRSPFALTPQRKGLDSLPSPRTEPLEPPRSQNSLPSPGAGALEGGYLEGGGPPL